jgi:hypothetical protein
MSTAVAVFNVFSVHVISLIVALLAVVAVFVYIPFVSDYAFWFMVSAYIMLQPTLCWPDIGAELRAVQ